MYTYCKNDIEYNIKKKMRIGILTFHRANNYGAVLQSLALQEKLIQLGYDVSIIDYRQKAIECNYNPIKWHIILGALRRPRLFLGYFFKALPTLFKTAKQYNRFRRRYLKCTKIVKPNNLVPQNFDIYMIGSDQLWNIDCTKEIDENYFGMFDHPKDSLIVGYAISTNPKSIEIIGYEKIASYMQKFSVVSFREQTIHDLILKKTGLISRVDIDPTLLLDKAYWENMIWLDCYSKKYILTYFLERHDEEELHKAINRFAIDKGLQIIDIYDVAKSPDTFLTYIYNAEYIFTTSFHAVVFSLIFEKKFYAIKSEEDHRYANLLQLVGVSDRLVNHDEFESVKPLNYVDIKCRIEREKSSSIDYLRKLRQ